MMASSAAKDFRMGAIDSFVISNKYGQQRMLDVVRDALHTADQVAISVSFLRCSGLGLVVDELKSFGERGGKVRFLTSTYMDVTQPEALRALRSFPAVDARLQIPGQGAGPSSGFHTKIYTFQGAQRACWVGSSNFSKGGLATNIEANLRHAGVREVAAVEDLFEQLWNRTDTLPVDDDVISWYEARRPRQSWSFPESQAAVLTAAYAGLVKEEPPHLYHQQLNGKANPAPNAAQREALERLAALRESGESRASVIAAPGVGKTYLAAFDAHAAGARSILFLSHRLEHLTQAQRTFECVFGDGVSYGLVFGGRGDGQSDLVFGTIQSVGNDTELSSRTFDYVVVDEFHHAAAPSYLRLLERLKPKFLLGLTATPERQDGHDVLRLCDYNVAYEVRLVQAINRGWLLPFHYFGVADETVNYGSIPWRSGRFDPEALENALMVSERVDMMLRHCLERGFDGPRRAAVGFCAGVRHAEFMAKALNERGMVAEFVTGSISVEDRERIYRRFADTEHPLEWLFVADILNEGVDIPAINSVVFLRPTESATIFIQQLGRGLRLSPGCEVLTVLDFVGHHRTAWLTIETLADRDASPGPSTVAELGLTPPLACEIILDVRTTEILEKIRTQSVSRKQSCLNAYKELRDEMGIDRPFPVDLLSHPELITIGDVRASFGSWLELRRAAGDAQPWEEALNEKHQSFQLLAAAERDWQAARVYGYAALWGNCARPDDPEAGYEAFFVRFPRWHVEYKPLSESKVASTLSKKLGALYAADRLEDSVFEGIPKDELLREIEGRLQLVLEKDYRLRHGGVIRRPADLTIHRRYDRPEIVNHFGQQYDPARHNLGVLRFGDSPDHIVLLTKLDTSGAIDRHQYTNRFDDPATFIWTSQNRQTQTNESGREVLDHKKRGIALHLFVQSGSHAKAIYCGQVDAKLAKGNAPMEVTFALRDPVTEAVLQELGANVPSAVEPDALTKVD